VIKNKDFINLLQLEIEKDLYIQSIEDQVQRNFEI